MKTIMFNMWSIWGMLLVLCMVLTLLPVTATAAANTLEVGVGIYGLTEVGLTHAIADANDGYTIKFISDGTITQNNYININKSITLDLNGQAINLQVLLTM